LARCTDGRLDVTFLRRFHTLFWPWPRLVTASAEYLGRRRVLRRARIASRPWQRRGEMTRLSAAGIDVTAEEIRRCVASGGAMPLENEQIATETTSASRFGALALQRFTGRPSDRAESRCTCSRLSMNSASRLGSSCASLFVAQSGAFGRRSAGRRPGGGGRCANSAVSAAWPGPDLDHVLAGRRREELDDRCEIAASRRTS
jgi:hypothetical protein